MNHSILIVEDDEDAAEYIARYLGREGLRVTLANSAINSFSLLQMQQFDLVLLDINLPDYDGFEICKRIRNQSGIPILFTSAYGDMEYKLKAFRLGADDYLIKPLDLRELVARIWVFLRRSQSTDMPSNPTSSIINDLHSKQILINQQPINFTATEYALFVVLLQAKGRVVTRKELGEHISVRALEFHIKNIRIKIQDDTKHPARLKSIYGVGYQLLI
ncbi:MAG: response regulator transcription factor [Campylobacterales bacterium]|nr:response regulator transcription factor [Campylobacterales bacterium]